MTLTRQAKQFKKWAIGYIPTIFNITDNNVIKQHEEELNAYIDSIYNEVKKRAKEDGLTDMTEKDFCFYTQEIKDTEDADFLKMIGQKKLF